MEGGWTASADSPTKQTWWSYLDTFAQRLASPIKITVAPQSHRSGPIENLFAGRFPGVSVTRADGGGLQIRIRGGSNTFYGSDEPLYVVDDTPLPSGSGGIVFLNPYDIQKIEVLKNPADTGLYGIRGANGVIRITTKKPGGR